ncbi:hypothetical protein ALC57_06300 [Trachymyrmex cornetzi]|uniref:Uncharacterized protein n=1 Tax=Trachymyrmex cornetzi TaxID=471704 RepID=A0A195E968_9HYME|nr:hypothetical protein ALC57_06300 [Trachymyrmex cornetzi]
MDAADYSGIQFFHRDAVNAVFVGVYSRHNFYGTNAGAAAQSARLASESSYRSSIRESAIRQPPELLLEMERPGYNGVQRGRHLKVKYLRGGGRERGKREEAEEEEVKRIEEEGGGEREREREERTERNAVEEEAFTRHLGTCGCDF